MAEEISNHIKQEIVALEEILREKKRELEAKEELAPSGVEGEKELLKKAVKEHIERARETPPAPPVSSLPNAQPLPSLTPSEPSQWQPVDDPLAGLDHREQIEELASIAFSKGIVEAVNVARRANNPHLLDEFHDALVDRLYDYLVQESIIEAK